MKMKILNNSPALARYESPTSEILTISQISPILSGSVRLGELEEETASWDEV